MSTHSLWLAAGRPRCGPIACKARAAKMLYKKTIRQYQQQEHSSYTNELHDALLSKDNISFWKCFKSKFDRKTGHVAQVNGLTDESEIAAKFADHLRACGSQPVSCSSHDRLRDVYNTRRPNYCGIPFDDYLLFDVELIDTSVRSLKRGKAADLDELSAEHVIHSHPALYSILFRLFNAMVKFNFVPSGFGSSYTVPILKNSFAHFNKTVTTDDFRGISISSIISKIFEKCILDRYQRFFETSDCQFGFKKGIGCSHAIFSVKNVVDKFVNNGSTVNLCALDMSKAYDRMSHHGLFIKLMDRMIPNDILSTLEYWFSICSTCVRWAHCYSDFFGLKCGVRQGGVLSPYLFSVFIDDIFDTVHKTRYGCHFGSVHFSIFLYADDIMLIAPSVTALQQL